MNINQVLDEVVKNEGGYVNRKTDKGGPTNFGITQKTLSNWLGRPASVQEIKDLSLNTATKIYRKNYFEDPKISKLDPRIWYLMLDTAVLFGPPRAIKFLQEAINNLGIPCEVDGVIGPQTIANSQRFDAKSLYNAVIDLRIQYHKRKVEADPSQREYLKGWINRAERVRAHAGH